MTFLNWFFNSNFFATVMGFFEGAGEGYRGRGYWEGACLTLELFHVSEQECKRSTRGSSNHFGNLLLNATGPDVGPVRRSVFFSWCKVTLDLESSKCPERELTLCCRLMLLYLSK